MNSVTILFVHLGNNLLPPFLSDNLISTLSVAPKSRVVLISNEIHRNTFNSIPFCNTDISSNRITFISVESLSVSSQTEFFHAQSKLDRSFRNGFWFHASERFYLIADYMHGFDIQNVLHIENDVQIYFDPTDKLSVFKDFADFAVPLDSVRSIPGIVWIKNKEIAFQLTNFMLDHPNMDDMLVLGKFCTEFKSNSKPLPTVPRNYANELGLDQNRYCQGFEEFEGVFDGAAIGQYIGGVHWLNNPESTRFFVNESSALDLRNFQFSWNVINGTRIPALSYDSIKIDVLSIHAHSKDLRGISPLNTNTPQFSTDIVTGERIQALTDLTLSSIEVTEFHGRENIQSKKMIEYPVKVKRNLFKKTYSLIPPGIEQISTCSSAKTIFVYTHLLDYFSKYILPRLNHKFILISHNSDCPITIDHLNILNNPNLILWLAQNTMFDHSKLRSLPIGMANSQWGKHRVDFLFNSSRKFIKSKSIYANFNTQTHSSRLQAFENASRFDIVTVQQGVTFESYIQELAIHKFCICPRGNGIDTHRFWEAQYLDCIPIILKCDWTAAYSGLPVVLLDSWDQLSELDYDRLYIEISSTSYDRSTLNLNFYSSLINYALSN